MSTLKIEKPEQGQVEQQPVQQPIHTSTFQPRKRPSLDFSGGNATLKTEFNLPLG